jgi:hypothetical protein
MQYPRTATIIPRGCAKSTLNSVILPTWDLLRDPTERILVASATLDLSRQLVGEIRDRLNGSIEVMPGIFAPVREVFPQLELDKSSRISQGPCETLNLVHRGRTTGRETSVFAGAVTAHLAGRHPTKASVDDLSDEQNSRTFAQRQKVVDWLTALIPVMKYPDSTIRMSATPWAFGDAVDWVSHNPKWHVTRFGVWVPENPETGIADGQGPGPHSESRWADKYAGHYPLCESFLNAGEIREIEEEMEGREAFFAAQYLCDPIPASDAFWDADFLAGITVPDILQNVKQGISIPKILLWDPVHKMEDVVDKGSRNGLVLIGYLPAGVLGLKGYKDPTRNVFFVLGSWEIRGSADNARAFIEGDLMRKHPDLQTVWIEKNAGQTFLKPWLEDRGHLSGVKIRMQKIGNADLGHRLQGVVSAMRTGYLFFPSEFEGKSTLERRLLEYPLSDSDDLPAALSMLSHHWERRGALPGTELPNFNWARDPWPTRGQDYRWAR